MEGADNQPVCSSPVLTGAAGQLIAAINVTGDGEVGV